MVITADFGIALACPMCAGALVNARVARLVYGAADAKAGMAGSLANICHDPRLNHRMEVVSGVLADEGAQLLSDFFREARARKRAGTTLPWHSRGQGGDNER